MTLERFVNLLATVTLFEMMVTIGLGVTPAEIMGVARDWRTLGSAALANLPDEAYEDIARGVRSIARGYRHAYEAAKSAYDSKSK